MSVPRELEGADLDAEVVAALVRMAERVRDAEEQGGWLIGWEEMRETRMEKPRSDVHDG